MYCLVQKLEVLGHVLTQLSRRDATCFPALPSPFYPKTLFFSVLNTAFLTFAPGVLSFSGLVQYTPGIVGAVGFSLMTLFSSHLPSKSGADENQVSFSPLPVSDPG
jgi:hypothetical protein